MNWLRETAWPWLRNWSVEIAAEWWADIEEKPRPHFVSIVLGMALYLIVKIAVRLAA